MCREFGGWGSLDECSEFSSCAWRCSIIAARSWRARGLLAGSTIATAVSASSAAASVTASTAISSAAFAAAIAIVLVCFVEAEQHGYVLLLLSLFIDVKC